MGRIKQEMIEAQGRFNFLDQAECNQVAYQAKLDENQISQRIAKAWHAHAVINKLKHNTEKRRQAQYYFISGAVAMLDRVPMMITMCLTSGRDLESIIEL